MNREQLADTGPDHDLEGRIESFELAFRMQTEAPELQDISGESEATLKMYGIDDPITEDFGRQCLMARRFSEKGVRFLQCSHTYKWDQHANLYRDHSQNAHEVDKPIAALIRDLKSRGLLEDTLVVWGGEFGRTPTAQGSDGRDHNPEAFTYWMAGGGVKPACSTAQPTTTATTRSRTRCTSTICMRRSCTCLGSTTSGSPTATPAATFA
ncbi:MAG: DUF1501 domain-containing protein [Bryobacterales bacterium]